MKPVSPSRPLARARVIARCFVGGRESTGHVVRACPLVGGDRVPAAVLPFHAPAHAIPRDVGRLRVRSPARDATGVPVARPSGGPAGNSVRRARCRGLS